ncbi:MAG: hypothetical protein PVJ58_05790 [Chromatiales bacterium]|jgi:hypothetical protein
MKIIIDTISKDGTQRIRDMLHYNLGGFEADISRVRVSLRSESDVPGKHLSCCRVTTHLMNKECIAVQELQFSEALAVTRAIERTGRAISRKRRSGHYSRSP